MNEFWRTVNRYLTWGDYIVIGLVLLGAAATVSLLRRPVEAGGQWALVRLEGKIVEQLPLTEDREITIIGPAGETVIQVHAGRVRVVESPGPQQVCVRQGWIQKPGEALICVPNRVTIEIPGNAGIDAISR